MPEFKAEDIYYNTDEDEFKFYHKLFLKCYEILPDTKKTIANAAKLARDSISVAYGRVGFNICAFSEPNEELFNKKLHQLLKL